MRRLVLALLVAAALTAGCVGLSDEEVSPDAADADTNLSSITPVEERAERNFTITEDGPSQTLEEGPFEPIVPGLGVRVNVELPATEGGGAAVDSAEVHMGVFLPDIPGCDWSQYGFNPEGGEVRLTAPDEMPRADSDVPERCQVPVVADVGPYYTTTEDRRNAPFGIEGDTPATEPATRLGGFLVEQLVPHGYAVAQVSVFGTGDSGHCMDLMGDSEQAGIDAAVEFLGEAPFSTGSVGLTGRSYDGTTPWEAASTPAANDHLDTIVPISGLTGLKDLMWRNGSAEARGGTGLLWGLYYSFGFDGTVEDVEHVACPDATVQGLPQHVAAWGTGGDMNRAEATYWEERSDFLSDALENYDGSVYLIHGLQDWNVDPHMAIPVFEKLQDEGIETKALLGQWAHNYPDRLEEHQACDGYEDRCEAPTSVRHDWAQDLLEWFDHYLKESREKPQLHAEVQDDEGYWRIHDTYPPETAEVERLTLDEAEALHDGPDVVAGGASYADTPGELVFDLGALSEDDATRIAGTPTFHVQVTPAGPGGQLFAELVDGETGEHLGHAVMDLRYHEGGDERQTVVPGETITAKMQFFAMDVVLPAGHPLELHLAQTGEDYMRPAVDTPTEVHATEQSVLTLPTVDPPAEAFFLPPGHADELDDGVPDDAE